MSLLGKKMLGLVSKSKKRDAKQVIPSYEQSQSIGIIYTFEGDKKEETIDMLLNTLGENKHVDVLCFMDMREITSSKHPSFHIEQLNNWGKIDSEEATKFSETSFDYLIHLDFEMNEIMKSLLNRTKAKCRVGFYSEKAEQYYELMIGINKSAGTTNFAEQIIKYIKSIR